MQKFHFIVFSLLLINFLIIPFQILQSQTSDLLVEKLKGFPTEENGISRGVSAGYAGIISNKIILAGGCNFPGKPAAEGGNKQFYSGIYTAELSDGNILKWTKAGELPVPSAYGVAVIYQDKLIIAGGNNEKTALNSVFSVSLTENGKVITELLPNLPAIIDNMAGAILNDILYLAGGKINGKPSKSLYALHLKNLKNGWIHIGDFPGMARVQPVMVAADSRLFLWGGFSPKFEKNKPQLTENGLCYTPETNKWTTVPAPVDKNRKPLLVAGGSAIAVNANEVLVTGGVNYDIFRSAIMRDAKLKAEKAALKSKEYLLHPASWYKFNKLALLYKIDTGEWLPVAENEGLARAGAMMVKHHNSIYYIQGETKPGIRTTEMSILKPIGKNDFAAYVNPFIGTGGHGHTFPGPTVPFGMIQPSPDTRILGWDACSGYHYTDSTINGFSHTHLSGTGIGDYGDILIMPTVGAQNIQPEHAGAQTLEYASAFSHQNETATPGYYSVFLDRYKVKAELTATARAAFHRYTFPVAENAGFIIDVDYSLQNHRNKNMHIQVLNNQTLIVSKNTYGWAIDQPVYMYFEFSKPFTHTIVSDSAQIPGTNRRKMQKKILLHFSTIHNEEILVRAGLSHVDAEGAKLNLHAEIPHTDFERTRSQARDAWNRYLGKIEVSGPDQNQKIIFYSALYHTGIAPNVFSDVDGRYMGMNRKIMQTEAQKPVYTVFSLWDTFRAFHPLMTVIDPERNNEFIVSLLKKYDEGGILPMWELAGNYTATMIGYNAVPVIVDAFMKGNRNFDTAKAYEAINRSSEYNPEGISTTRWLAEMGLSPISKKYKNTIFYVPCDTEHESVAKGLEYAYADWCIARFAEAIGDSDTREKYDFMAKSYRNYYDKSTGFMRGKDLAGNWRTPFSPYHSNHREDDYCEGTAWQWTWFVPHDVKGLMTLMGGKKAFVTKLDSLFNTNTRIEGENVSSDISGLIGQYAHGNEPGHHIIHLYNYAGQSNKTQQLADSVIQSLYFNDPNGLSGNEDCGQMSAWYVLNALGFYQVSPGNPEWSTGRPIFEKAIIHLPDNKQFIIEAENQARQNKYVEKITLNGKRLKKPFFSHSAIMNGGTLKFKMSDKIQTK